MRDRGQKRRAQPIGLGGSLGALQVFDQAHALGGERALIDQRVEQAPLIGREQRSGLVAVDADDADGAAARSHGQKQALGARKRIGAAPGGMIVLPRPIGGCDVGLIENILGRIAGLHDDRAVFRQ